MIAFCVNWSYKWDEGSERVPTVSTSSYCLEFFQLHSPVCLRTMIFSVRIVSIDFLLKQTILSEQIFDQHNVLKSFDNIL